MAARKSAKPPKSAKSPKSTGVAKQAQVEFPSADGAKLGKCRVCGADTGPKSSLCATHRALLARKRDRALFLAIKGTEEGKVLIQKVTKKGVLAHLGL